MDANISFHDKEIASPEGDVAREISLTGLKGGHSGVDIHLQRANANKLIVRFLKDAVSSYEARLASIDGGSLRNAIPREAHAIITVPKDGVDDIMVFVEECNELFVEEFDGVENNINLTAKAIDLPTGLIPEEVQDDLINGVTACFNGVYRVLPEMPSVVETSNNVAIIKSDGTKVEIKSLLRSSVDSRKEELASIIESTFTVSYTHLDVYKRQHN